MTRNEAIFELIKYRRRLEEDPTIIFARGSFDAEPFDMAVEALERKHGEWIPHEMQVPWGDGTTDVTMFRCSVCGYEQDWQSKFCPNCGADMRGDECER